MRLSSRNCGNSMISTMQRTPVRAKFHVCQQMGHGLPLPPLMPISTPSPWILSTGRIEISKKKKKKNRNVSSANPSIICFRFWVIKYIVLVTNRTKSHDFITYVHISGLASYKVGGTSFKRICDIIVIFRIKICLCWGGLS